MSLTSLPPSLPPVLPCGWMENKGTAAHLSHLELTASGGRGCRCITVTNRDTRVAGRRSASPVPPAGFPELLRGIRHRAAARQSPGRCCPIRRQRIAFVRPLEPLEREMQSFFAPFYIRVSRLMNGKRLWEQLLEQRGSD